MSLLLGMLLPKKSRVGVTLSDSEFSRLAAQADRLGVSKSVLVACCYAYCAHLLDEIAFDEGVSVHVTRRHTQDRFDALLNALLLEGEKHSLVDRDRDQIRLDFTGVGP